MRRPGVWPDVMPCAALFCRSRVFRSHVRALGHAGGPCPPVAIAGRMPGGSPTNRSDAPEAATGISFFGVVGGAAIPSGVIVYGVWQRRHRRQETGRRLPGEDAS